MTTFDTSDFGSALYSRLNTGTAVTALLSGTTAIYYQIAPEQADMPYIVWNYQAVTDAAYSSHKDIAVLANVRAYSGTAAYSGSIQKQIDARINTPLNISGFVNFWVARDDYIDTVEMGPDNKLIWGAGGIYRYRFDTGTRDTAPPGTLTETHVTLAERNALDAAASPSTSNPFTTDGMVDALIAAHAALMASAAQAGHLSAADWTTFNNKQSALGYTPVNKAGDTMTGTLTMQQPSAADCVIKIVDPFDANARSWYEIINTSVNPGEPTRDNVVWAWGYNHNGSGVPIDATECMFYSQFESHYNPSGTAVMEWHLNWWSIDPVPGSRLNVRPIMLGFQKSAPWTNTMDLTANTVNFKNGDATGTLVANLACSTATAKWFGTFQTWTTDQVTQNFSVSAAGAVVVGSAATVAARLCIAGSADEVQLAIKAYSTQTNVIQTWNTSAGAVFAGVDLNGVYGGSRTTTARLEAYKLLNANLGVQYQSIYSNITQTAAQTAAVYGAFYIYYVAHGAGTMTASGYGLNSTLSKSGAGLVNQPLYGASIQANNTGTGALNWLYGLNVLASCAAATTATGVGGLAVDVNISAGTIGDVVGEIISIVKTGGTGNYIYGLKIGDIPAGVLGTYSIHVGTGRVHLGGLSVYADNAAAITGGLAAGDLYRTNADPDPVCIVH